MAVTAVATTSRWARWMSGGRNASATGMQMIRSSGVTTQSGRGVARHQACRALFAFAVVATLTSCSRACCRGSRPEAVVHEPHQPPDRAVTGLPECRAAGVKCRLRLLDPRSTLFAISTG